MGPNDHIRFLSPKAKYVFFAIHFKPYGFKKIGLGVLIGGRVRDSQRRSQGAGAPYIFQLVRRIQVFSIGCYRNYRIRYSVYGSLDCRYPPYRAILLYRVLTTLRTYKSETSPTRYPGLSWDFSTGSERWIVSLYLVYRGTFDWNPRSTSYAGRCASNVFCQYAATWRSRSGSDIGWRNPSLSRPHVNLGTAPTNTDT